MRLPIVLSVPYYLGFQVVELFLFAFRALVGLSCRPVEGTDELTAIFNLHQDICFVCRSHSILLCDFCTVLPSRISSMAISDVELNHRLVPGVTQISEYFATMAGWRFQLPAESVAGLWQGDVFRGGRCPSLTGTPAAPSPMPVLIGKYMS